MSLRARRGAPDTGAQPADGTPPAGGRARDEDWGLRWALLGTLAVIGWLILCLALR